MLQQTILLAEPELLKFKWAEVPITQAPKLRKKVNLQRWVSNQVYIYHFKPILSSKTF